MSRAKHGVQVMGIRQIMVALLACAALTGGVSASSGELGFLQQGELRFDRKDVDQRSALLGPGVLETGAKSARIALAIGGHVVLEPGTAVRLTYDDSGTVTVTVLRGLVVLEPKLGKKLTAGRNSVFRLDEATMRSGNEDERDYGDE